MPHDIDVGSATKKDCSNPYATKNSITIKPHRHKRKEDKIHQTIIDIVLLIDKNKLKTYNQLLSEPNIVIRIITLCALREVEIVTESGKKINKKNFASLAKKYMKDKVDSDVRFAIEDILRNTAEEMLEEYRKADAELKGEKNE